MDPVTLAIFGVSTLLGGVTGWLSADTERRKKQEQLQRQKEQAWAKYELGKAYSDQQYGINRTEAHTGLAIQQRRLDEDVDSSIGQFNTGLLAQAYGIQNARIETASSIGASRAAEGMSGTRGNAANELMRAYEQTSLDRNIDLQYQQNDEALSGMITQANRGMQDISRERASWDPGGYRYQSKAAQDDYNLKMAQLGQSDFDWAINNAAGWEDYALSALSGASSGLSTANSLVNALNLSGWGSGGTETTSNWSTSNWSDTGLTASQTLGVETYYSDYLDSLMPSVDLGAISTKRTTAISPGPYPAYKPPTPYTFNFLHPQSFW
ncbi:MAG: hypothetical protein LBF63_11330 [Treponema sp.]|jgi:hypothetical protein|nr:hypothetical protein [Treponema sp.]